MNDPVHAYLEALDAAQSAKVRWRAASLFEEETRADPGSADSYHKTLARQRVRDKSMDYEESRESLRLAFCDMFRAAFVGGSTGEQP